MSKAKILSTFYDLQAGCYRYAGESFDATPQRVADINAAAKAQGLGPFAEAAKPERPKAPEGE